MHRSRLARPAFRLQRAWILVPVTLCLTACRTTSGDLAELRLGMARVEVLQVLGRPNYAAADDDGAEYLIYRLPDPSAALQIDEYFVRFVAGKLKTYGRPGGIGSPHLPVPAPSPKNKQAE